MAGQAGQNLVPTAQSLAMRHIQTVISESPCSTPDFYESERAPGRGIELTDRRGFFTEFAHAKVNILQGLQGATAVHNQKVTKALEALGNPSATAMGVGLTVPNFGPVLHLGLKREDWVSLYRSLPREIYTFGDEDSHSETEAQLWQFDQQLLDANQYDSDASFLTVLVYGEGDYGQASIFEVELGNDVHPFEGGHPTVAIHIKPLATAPAVPRQALEKMSKAVQSKIVLHKKNHKTELKGNGPDQPDLYINIVEIWSTDDVKHYWAVGEGWKGALGIPVRNAETEGFRATLPQMLALLHLRGSGYEGLTSSPAVWFRDDTHGQPVSVHDVQAHRAILFEKGSKATIANQGTDFHVAVLFPMDVEWPREPFFWG